MSLCYEKILCYQLGQEQTGCIGVTTQQVSANSINTQLLVGQRLLSQLCASGSSLYSDPILEFSHPYPAYSWHQQFASEEVGCAYVCTAYF